MRIASFRTLGVSFLAGIIALAMFGRLNFDAALAIAALSLFFASPSTSFFWAFGVGLAYAQVSPVSPLAYLLVFAAAYACMRAITGRYVSHRSFAGVIGVSCAGVFLFEALFYVAVKLSGSAHAFWAPEVNWFYVRFVLYRAIATAAATGIIYFLLQRFSPRLRGVLITHR